MIKDWNKVYYIDCMDPEKGLPSLPDKSIDLGFTDPPWGVNFGKAKELYKSGKKIKRNINIKEYNDQWNPLFQKAYFRELERICNRIIIVTGQWHLDFWYKLKPKGMLIIHTRNHVARDSKIASWNHYTPYLYWGKFKHKLYSNVIDYTIPWGFLSKERFTHPSPKGTEIALKLFTKLKPASIIDPFTGSGSYIKAADILDIPWIGYEINKEYSIDINKRFSKKLITSYI